MAAMAMESRAEELSWFRQLANLPGAKTLLGAKHRQPTWSEKSREWRAFDLADVMEQGLARELTTGFTEPAAENENRELTVCRSDDEQEHVLLSKDESPLLISRHVPKERSINFFIPSDGDPPCALGPAFKLTYSEDKLSWELYSTRCEKCEYLSPARLCNAEGTRRTLLRVYQERLEIGNGQAMLAEVEMPKPEEVWCTSCCARGNKACISARDGQVVLSSRLPKWNRRMKSLTLDFKGRCDRASSKNFQLVNHQDGEDPQERVSKIGDVVFQYGKMDTNMFCLDFRGPSLGTAQAFALALSSTFWH